MKDLKDSLKNKLLSEGLKIGANTKVNTYKYHPKTYKELKTLIIKLIDERGFNANLNDINTSDITDMKDLFFASKFNGDISEWDVSNVTNMYCMFAKSKFNGDISKWDVSNVKNMRYMFYFSEFNGDISEWDVSNVKEMFETFLMCPLAKNPPKWYKE